VCVNGRVRESCSQLRLRDFDFDLDFERFGDLSAGRAGDFEREPDLDRLRGGGDRDDFLTEGDRDRDRRGERDLDRRGEGDAERRRTGDRDAERRRGERLLGGLRRGPPRR